MDVLHEKRCNRNFVSFLFSVGVITVIIYGYLVINLKQIWQKETII